MCISKPARLYEIRTLGTYVYVRPVQALVGSVYASWGTLEDWSEAARTITNQKYVTAVLCVQVNIIAIQDNGQLPDVRSGRACGDFTLRAISEKSTSYNLEIFDFAPPWRRRQSACSACCLFITQPHRHHRHYVLHPIFRSW